MSFDSFELEIRVERTYSLFIILAHGNILAASIRSRKILKRSVKSLSVSSSIEHARKCLISKKKCIA